MHLKRDHFLYSLQTPWKKNFFGRWRPLSNLTFSKTAEDNLPPGNCLPVTGLSLSEASCLEVPTMPLSLCFLRVCSSTSLVNSRRSMSPVFSFYLSFFSLLMRVFSYSSFSTLSCSPTSCRPLSPFPLSSDACASCGPYRSTRPAPCICWATRYMECVYMIPVRPH